MRPIIFITGTISQPRVIKRIVSIAEAGFPVSVYGFNRGVYNCNVFPQNIEVNIAGDVKDGGDYLTKIKQTKALISEIIAKESEKSPIFYTFGIIGAYFLYKQRVDYVYELSDVLYGYPKFNVIRPVLKAIERRIIIKSKLTVMTSLGFKEYFFLKKNTPNIIVQPNKLNSVFKDYNRPNTIHVAKTSYRFAFVGAIRYENTILRFAKVVGEHFPNQEFHFYGESMMSEMFKNETSKYPNIFFHGKFRNPEDLKEIYESVDVIVSAYHTDSLNERIAEPNKLYESIYFLKPIIVSQGTFLEKQVQKYKCGFAIDCYSESAIKQFILSLNDKILSEIQDNESAVPTCELIDNPDKIIQYLKSL